MLELLRADVDRTLALVGVPRVDDVDARILSWDAGQVVET
jgi:isopentenyl diphosphate isomerase/L-lactate dehydrogenase-like FMN-dependent dehydrogenase